MQKHALVLAILWAIVIMVLSLISGTNLPKVDFDLSDKVGHFVVYAILSFLVYHAAAHAKTKSPILICILLPVCYGVLMEFLQSALSDERSADAMDAVANALGSLCIALIMFLRR